MASLRLSKGDGGADGLSFCFSPESARCGGFAASFFARNLTRFSPFVIIGKKSGEESGRTVPGETERFDETDLSGREEKGKKDRRAAAQRARPHRGAPARPRRAGCRGEEKRRSG